MIVAAVLLSASLQSPPTASSLLTQMFSRHHSAQTLTGTIVLTQSVGNESGRIESKIQYERPSRLYIRQQMMTASGTTWLVTADGKHFSYNKPRDTNQISVSTGNRLIEAIQTKNGKLDLGGIYAACSKSIGDRSAPLDIAIARKEDLSFLRMQWATMKVSGSKEIEGSTYWLIEGNWREYGEARVSGRFQLLVSENGDLKLYQLTESISVNGQALPMTSKWEVNLKAGAVVDPALFKVVL